MTQIIQTPLPETALLARYSDIPGANTDCFACHVSKHIHLETYIRTFFSTPLFRIERALLRMGGVRRTATADLAAMANGQTDTWAAWQVEDRDVTQILMQSGSGSIRTWLMIEPLQSGGTTLMFGSAVLPSQGAPEDEPRLPFFARALMGFHTLYSKLLLRAATRKLTRTKKAGAKVISLLRLPSASPRGATMLCSLNKVY